MKSILLSVVFVFIFNLTMGFVKKEKLLKQQFSYTKLKQKDEKSKKE